MTTIDQVITILYLSYSINRSMPYVQVKLDPQKQLLTQLYNHLKFGTFVTLFDQLKIFVIWMFDSSVITSASFYISYGKP